ncbi:hypothetical protein LEM8419_00994 [Neolewinella maritima]|uniref:Thymidine kinase n=1 Tax=Neolewinella maritima TaxID=1383882 RepID=A0ABM9AYK7_9BACT|nr:hypothetical protein [Neolewinella maritima]CAH0999694.1 hypothetical protein LEM8419_00994 [Neolewinella maritima]
MIYSLPTDAGGMLKPGALDQLGGPYSLYVRLWRGGTGSPRVIYTGGVRQFDALRRDVGGEVAFLTMEELSRGLVFRLNINQRIACVGILKADVDFVHLLAYRVRVRIKRQIRIVHRGDLRFDLRDGTMLTMEVIVRKFQAVDHYFRKCGLCDRYSMEVSTADVENDSLY